MKFKEAAVKQFREMMKKEGKDSIRVFVIPSCCSPAVVIDAEKGKKGDKLVKQDEVNIFVAEEAFEMLSSAEVDYIKGEFKISGLSQTGSSCCG